MYARRLLLLLGMVLLAAAALAQADPATPRLDPRELQPGEFAWYPQAAPSGPLLMVVSIPEQRAYLYRNGVRIATSTVSTGKAGNETPPGVYSVLQKRKEHYSNLYDDAPMPFMQRLTWGGIALHAGRLPGYPASHGCIRLPLEFARQLFGVSALGMTVIVSDEAASPPEWVHPGWLAPPLPAPATAAPATPALVPTTPAPPAAGGEEFAWNPAAAPEGPLTILVSTADRSLRVLRSGVEIGAARIELDGPAPTGTLLLHLQEGVQAEESRFVAGRPRLRWLQVPLGGSAGSPEAADALYRGLRISPRFAQLLYDSLAPGTTVLVTDMPAGPIAPMADVLDTQ